MAVVDTGVVVVETTQISCRGKVKNDNLSQKPGKIKNEISVECHICI